MAFKQLLEHTKYICSPFSTKFLPQKQRFSGKIQLFLKKQGDDMLSMFLNIAKFAITTYFYLSIMISSRC